MGKHVHSGPPLPVVGAGQRSSPLGSEGRGAGGVGMQPQNARLSSQTK